MRNKQLIIRCYQKSIFNDLISSLQFNQKINKKIITQTITKFGVKLKGLGNQLQ